MRVAVAFTGPSNSGKTTIIEKVAQKLINTYKVAIVKNDPKDKAQFDTEGKDSYRFFQTGAEVVVTSPTRTTYFSHRRKSIDEIIEMIHDFDILLVEGLKYLPLPRIGVFRGELDPSYFGFIKAVAIDHTIDASQVPEHLDILDLNDTDQIIQWILNNAQEV
ncbi:MULTISPECIES: molybdopterin-guanine dinucleotide biosynthesis protein B [unclassified Nitratiruptor]|uniref:molybdopterin-guanine dinucleotide biosynthesis protein B n=1 Tax=unclassified Nitratiruptor TaxID=2624044 RepID=UPI001915EDFB|nr:MULTISPECIES: molybdopterin-guanine dinucleotide biosynthesis protein B [unclassified Nitratiruptor]BCD60482.1 molybdopterin-guanine dinucleotide biosynthesis adapter protein [Nitratiruptor sp. YY08-10]BCD64029.1 molybdopterin-guanine dinucleotide biosynthesis adapter protein [Nitratiruptor sp. YY08-14]